ncbi:unnamed protein product [Arctogadus glacialis]
MQCEEKGCAQNNIAEGIIQVDDYNSGRFGLHLRAVSEPCRLVSERDPRATAEVERLPGANRHATPAAAPSRLQTGSDPHGPSHGLKGGLPTRRGVLRFGLDSAICDYILKL